MTKKKFDKQVVAFWVYIALMILWSIYGLWNSGAAEGMIRALSGAFQMLFE